MLRFYYREARDYAIGYERLNPIVASLEALAETIGFAALILLCKVVGHKDLTIADDAHGERTICERCGEGEI